MIVLEGLPALSPFRRERLQSKISQIAADAVLVGAWHVYFIEHHSAENIDKAMLERILEAGTSQIQSLTGSVSRIITPRLGTRSPWSSKATEILKGVKLPVSRVERGLRIDILGGPESNSSAWKQIDNLISDPMIQTVWSS